MLEIKVSVELGERTLQVLEGLGKVYAVIQPGAVEKQAVKAAEAVQEVERSEAKQEEPVGAVQATQTVQAASSPVPTAVPTATRSYTMEELGQAGAAIMDRVGVEALQNLVQSFGVASLSDMDPSQYPSFANKLRELGANL